MAKVHIDRLADRHNYSGQKYRALVQTILGHNSRAVHNRIGEITSTEWSRVNKKIPKTKEQLKLPSIDEILPARSLQLLKAAQKGNLITDTLRDAMTKKLRERITEFTEKPTAKIDRNMVKAFEQDIRDVYDGYTKRDKRFGMPTNVHTIAVTEVRIPIAKIKNEYAAKIHAKNPDVIVMKKWVHNRGLSKVPRTGHMRLNGQTIGLNDMFHVKQFKQKYGRWMPTGVEVDMKHPHDGSAPEGEVIGCNCDCVYITKRVKR